MVWETSDGLLVVEEPSLTSPLLVKRRDRDESFAYDAYMDTVEGSDGNENAWELRVQLDEIRGILFTSRARLGLPLTLAEILWRPRIYFHVKDDVFVVPNLGEGDVYPREVRYGACVVDEVLSSDDPFNQLVFDGYQAAEQERWIRKDGQVMPVTELHVAHAPLSSTTQCSRPWASAGVDDFLVSHERDGWEALFMPSSGVFE